ncbi:MAG: hypothetical protein M3N95_07475 [Actinomycetota bacterium]|nr:hypothetical protein [Actinomycetota bacterium]
MTVADRIDPVTRRWVAPAAVDEAYVGKHRRAGYALMSLLALPRMFYTARHREL